MKLLSVINLFVLLLISTVWNANAASISSIKISKINSDNERLIINAKYNKTIRVTHDDNKVYITLKEKISGKGDVSANSKYIKSISVKDNTIFIILKSNPGKIRKFIGDNVFGIELIKSSKIDDQNQKSSNKPANDPNKAIKEEKSSTKSISNNKNVDDKNQKKLVAIKKGNEQSDKLVSPVIDSRKQEYVLKLPFKSKAEGEEEQNSLKEEPVVKAPIQKVSEKITQTNLIKYSQIGHDIELTFEWQSPTGAAIFQRSGYIYVVFDNNENPPVASKDIPITLNYTSGNNYSMYKISSHQNVKINRQYNTWIITLTDSNVPKDAYEIGESQITPEFHIAFTIPGLIKGVEITDPDTAENFIVYTVNNDVINLEKVYKFTDFDLLKTYLGAVLLKKNDNVKAYIKKNKLIIDSPSYKKISMNYQTKDSLFDFGNWQKPVPNFNTKLEKILYDLTKTETRQKYLQRLRLVDFYFQNGMTVEAESALENAILNDPYLQKNLDIKIKMALLSFLNGKYVVAKNRFNNIDISQVHPKYINEISMWIAVTNLMVNDEYQDRRINYVINSEFFLKKYPLKLRNQIALIELEDMIDNKEFDAAKDIIQHISTAIDPDYINDLKYLQAVLFELTNDKKSAIKILKNLSKDPLDIKNRARASFNLARIEHEEGKLSVNDALDQMENSLTIWRGDKTEAHMLIYYGNLAYNNGFYNKAFRAWQRVVEDFIDLPESIVLASDMSKKFVDIFGQKTIPKNMTEMEFVSLFFEFRELTPIGEKGDDIVISMVDKLVDLDLLEQAQSILNHQIRFRSKGQERNNLIKQLAYLYLIDNKAKQAIDILSLPLDYPLDFEESRTFKYLKATAYAQDQNYDMAFSMLKNDLSTKATGIRTDIYWLQRNWSAIKNELNVATEIWSETDGFVEPLQEKLIIKLAVAYEMLNDKDAILRLRKQFYMRFRDGNNKELLNYLSQEPIKSDVRMIANNLDGKLLDNVVSNYKDLIYKNYNLSTVAY